MQSPTASVPSTGSRWQRLLDQMPRPDKEEKILQNVEEGQIEKIVAELLAGGREAIVALVDSLVEPGAESTDSPARHALHALATYVGGLGAEQRRATAAAFASTLGGSERPAGVRAFVVRQLQVCGGDESAPALGALLADDTLFPDAAMALLAIGGAGATGQFRAALPDVTGPQRVAVIGALGKLKDRESADPLRRACSRDPDPVARMEAAWALANIGDSGAVDIVLKAADEARGFDRIRATDACLLLAENLVTAGGKDSAAKIHRHLRDTRTDATETYVRQIAEQALRE